MNTHGYLVNLCGWDCSPNQSQLPFPHGTERKLDAGVDHECATEQSFWVRGVAELGALSWPTHSLPTLSFSLSFGDSDSVREQGAAGQGAARPQVNAPLTSTGCGLSFHLSEGIAHWGPSVIQLQAEKRGPAGTLQQKTAFSAVQASVQLEDEAGGQDSGRSPWPCLPWGEAHRAGLWCDAVCGNR